MPDTNVKQDLTSCQASIVVVSDMAEQRLPNALLALNLRVAREAKNLTQEEAGRLIGRTRQTIIAWENADSPTKPDEEILSIVAKVYGVPARSLRYDRFGIHFEPRATPQEIDDDQRRLENPNEREPDLPPALELMALDFEKEALGAGADRKFMRFARATMHEPSLVAMFVGGASEKPMPARQQRVEFEAVVDGLRIMLNKRLRYLKKK